MKTVGVTNYTNQTPSSSFGHLDLISVPVVVSKFHNETHDPKAQENKIYTMVKDRETFSRLHTVPGKFEYKGMKTVGVTDYTHQTPLRILEEKKSKIRKY